MWCRPQATASVSRLCAANSDICQIILSLARCMQPDKQLKSVVHQCLAGGLCSHEPRDACNAASTHAHRQASWCRVYRGTARWSSSCMPALTRCSTQRRRCRRPAMQCRAGAHVRHARPDVRCTHLACLATSLLFCEQGACKAGTKENLCHTKGNHKYVCSVHGAAWPRPWRCGSSCASLTRC